jgi:hypothetical protein
MDGFTSGGASYGPQGVGLFGGNVIVSDVGGEIRYGVSTADGQHFGDLTLGATLLGRNAGRMAVLNGHLYITNYDDGKVTEINSHGVYVRDVFTLTQAECIQADILHGQLIVHGGTSTDILTGDPIAHTTSVLHSHAHLSAGFGISADGSTVYQGVMVDLTNGTIDAIDTGSGSITFTSNNLTSFFPSGAAQVYGLLAGIVIAYGGTGIVSSIDLSTKAQGGIATGGDFIGQPASTGIVLPDGSLLLTQGATIYRLRAPSGSAFTAGSTATIDADPASYSPCVGTGVLLTWTTTNADTVTIDNGVGSVSASGSTTVYPSFDTVYTITATKNTITATDTATVTVIGVAGVRVNTKTATPTYFNSGATYPPGLYRVRNINGGYRYKAGGGITVNGRDNTASPTSQPGGNFILYGNQVYMTPGNVVSYPNQATCDTANGGIEQFIQHTGGPIAVYLADDSYTNNTHGSPDPTFILCGPAPYGKLTASPASIQAGASVTITYHTENATTASVDHGIGSVGADGTFSVSPAVTTTYTLTMTGLGFTSITTVTVTACTPSVPSNVTATGTCAGTIILAWTGSTCATGYSVERSATGTGSWSEVGTPLSPTYTDNPTPNTTFYYRVRATDGTNYSGYCPTLSAATLVVPQAAPGSVTISLALGLPYLTWAAVAGATSYSIYRGTATGTETLLIAGITRLVYNDVNASYGVPTYYTVKAANSCGEGAASAEVSITPQPNLPAFTVADAPGNTFV